MFGRRHRTPIIDIVFELFGVSRGLIIIGVVLRALTIIVYFLDMRRFVFTHELLSQAIDTMDLWCAICAIIPYASIGIGVYRLLVFGPDNKNSDDQEDMQ